jgi:oligopeptide transport system substrate-binding protein
VYDLEGNPRTLDPQTAVDEHARLVIANLFEGLLRMDSQGNITFGAAMEYEKSVDSLTYTFYLRDDIFWTDGKGFQAQCTSHDFVFAFRRLFNPEVKSRNAAEYYSILNSRAVHEGEMPLDSLGVYADGDFRLIIRLEEPDVNFPVLLTAPPAFPCNEEFYIKASGRYGLIADAVPSNGGFYLREWVYDPWWTDENRITLRRNELNSKSERVYPRGVNFLMDRGGHIGNFTSGQSDCIVISGDGVNDLIRRNFPYTAAENSVWGVTFNSEGVFANEDLRLALARATDINAVEINQTGYRRASAIIPDGIKIGGEFFRELAGSPDDLDSGAPVSAANLMTEPPVLILPVTSENDVIDIYVKAIAQQWQEKLSLFCRIEALPVREYAERLADGDYDIAVARISAAYNSPSAILTQFPSAVELVSQARMADTVEDAVRYFRMAEHTVGWLSAEFIPICFMEEYFFHNRRSEDLMYNPFTGAVIFRNAKRF